MGIASGAVGIMGIFLLPSLSSTPAPIPLEPKLPELCKTLCADCDGTGYQATADLQDAWRCPTCDGYGALAVCSVCGEVPASDTDACSCVSLCEACGERPQSTDALCSVCLIEGFRKVLADDREGLERYLELKSRDLTAPEKTLELDWAASQNWL